MKLLLATMILTASFLTQAQERSSELLSLYNPAHVEIGINGWDPVSFFREGINAEIGPQEGLAEITTTYQGITYNFSSEENRTVFLANPDRYEMTYGGWCAWAMVSNGRAPIDVRYYSFDDEDEKNRIHFFVGPTARDSFNGIRRGRVLPDALERRMNNEDSADGHWFNATEELPRGKNR